MESFGCRLGLACRHFLADPVLMPDRAAHTLDLLPLGAPLPEGTASFGTDGIRGRVGQVITPALALQLGYWCGRVLPEGGPVLLGMRQPFHILQMGSSVREIVDMVRLAVVDAHTHSAA